MNRYVVSWTDLRGRLRSSIIEAVDRETAIRMVKALPDYNPKDGANADNGHDVMGAPLQGQNDPNPGQPFPSFGHGGATRTEYDR